MTTPLSAALDQIGSSLDPGRILNTMNAFEQMKTRNQQREVVENAWSEHQRRMESDSSYKKLATQVSKNFPMADVSNPQQLQQMLKTISAAQDVDGSLELLVSKGVIDQKLAEALRPQMVSDPAKMSQFLLTHAQGVASANRDIEFRKQAALEERQRLQGAARQMLKVGGFKGKEREFYASMIEQAPREAIQAIREEFNDNERLAEVEARIKAQNEREDAQRKEAKDEKIRLETEKKTKDNQIKLATIEAIKTTDVIPTSEKARLAGLVEAGYPAAQAQAYIQSLEVSNYREAATLRQKQDTMDLLIQNIDNATLPEAKKAPLRNLVKAGQYGAAVSQLDNELVAGGGRATGGKASANTFLKHMKEAKFVNGLISKYEISGDVNAIEEGVLDAIVDMYELDDRSQVNSIFDVKDIRAIVEQIDDNQNGKSGENGILAQANAQILGEFVESGVVSPHVLVGSERKTILTPTHKGVQASFPVSAETISNNPITGAPIIYSTVEDGSQLKIVRRVGNIIREVHPEGGVQYVKEVPVINPITLEVTTKREVLSEKEAHWETREQYFRGMSAKDAYDSVEKQSKVLVNYLDDMAEKISTVSQEQAWRLQSIIGKASNLSIRTSKEGRRYKFVSRTVKSDIFTPTRRVSERKEITRFNSDHEAYMSAADVALEMQDIMLQFHSVLTEAGNVNP